MKRYICSIAFGAILGSPINLAQANTDDYGGSHASAMKCAETDAASDTIAPGTLEPTDRRGRPNTDSDAGDEHGDIEIQRRPAGDAPLPADRHKMVPPEGGFYPAPDSPGHPHD